MKISLPPFVLSIFIAVLLSSCGGGSEVEENSDPGSAMDEVSEPVEEATVEDSQESVSEESVETIDYPVSAPDPIVAESPRPRDEEIVAKPIPVETSPVLDEDSTVVSKPSLEDFEAQLRLDRGEMKKHEVLEVEVWIGAKSKAPKPQQNAPQDGTDIPAKLGQFAKVELIAPKFKLIAGESGKCVRIDASGSNVIFKLEPLEDGELTVGATVDLFENADCSGAAVPKSIRSLEVNVSVDRKEVAKSKFGEIMDVLWTGFMDFWGAFVALIFGAILFFVRKKIYGKKKNDSGEDNS